MSEPFATKISGEVLSVEPVKDMEGVSAITVVLGAGDIVLFEPTAGLCLKPGARLSLYIEEKAKVSEVELGKWDPGCEHCHGTGWLPGGESMCICDVKRKDADDSKE